MFECVMILYGSLHFFCKIFKGGGMHIKSSPSSFFLVSHLFSDSLREAALLPDAPHGRLHSLDTVVWCQKSGVGAQVESPKLTGGYGGWKTDSTLLSSPRLSYIYVQKEHSFALYLSLCFSAEEQVVSICSSVALCLGIVRNVNLIV